MQDTTNQGEVRMDPDTLTREEIYSDGRIGSIRKLIPVTADGDVDPDRDVQFLGSTQIMTPAGALPLNFEIEAGSLSEAIDKFGEMAQQAVEQTMEELKELQRQAASQIVVPKAGMDPGALGGGSIQMP